MTHTTYPVSIPLPNGLRAELVYALPLHDPPVYAIDDFTAAGPLLPPVAGSVLRR